MIIKNEKPLVAISYNTRTFKMLERFINNEDPTLTITCIDPAEFIAGSSDDKQYINLVTKDMAERAVISNLLDERGHDRFSYIDTSFTSPDENTTWGAGCLVYPGVMTYYGNFGKDVMIHGRCNFAEGVSVGNGTFFSGTVTVAGDVSIGDFCFISTNVLILDHVRITNDVRILPATNIRKSIKKSGTYYNPNAYKLEEIKL